MRVREKPRQSSLKTSLILVCPTHRRRVRVLLLGSQWYLYKLNASADVGQLSLEGESKVHGTAFPEDISRSIRKLLSESFHSVQMTVSEY